MWRSAPLDAWRCIRLAAKQGGEDHTLSHVSGSGQPQMVDVSGKGRTARVARAQAVVRLPAEVRALIRDDELHAAKGPVFHTAILAGVMAAKRTSELIPLCHPIGLDGCDITITLDEAGDAVVVCEARVEHRTGVEMEALTGASVAALTIYDMCKAVSHDIRIDDLRLLEKRGGKSDYRAVAASSDDR